MNYDAIYWVIIIACLLISIPVSFSMNDSLHKNHPEVKPYAWGYYIGWMGMLNSSAFSIVQFISASKTYGRNSDTFAVLGLILLIVAITHFFIIKRNKWAWVIGIAFQLNPILWIINGIYLKNRWTEMSGVPVAAVSKNIKKASLSLRVYMAGTGFWAIVVLTFIFTFEPYGSYVSNSEWWQIAKIIFFPPVVVSVGYFLYCKVIKQEIQELQ